MSRRECESHGFETDCPDCDDHELHEAVRLLLRNALGDRGYCEECGAEKVGDVGSVEQHAPDCALRVFLEKHA